VGLVLVFVGWPQLLLAETPVASIELEKEVYFLTPDEATVVVPPGFYTVEAEENGLQLTQGLLPDEGGETFLLQAKPGTHEESVEGPIAQSIAVEEDAYYLTLLLPDGQSLVAIGSYSGVRPRGAGWWERLSQKAEKALVAVKDRYEEMTEWNRRCKKRFTKANDINNCCASKYNSCKRACRKKGKQRVSCQQQCETLNEGCWIRRDANPNWMVNYCGNTKNQRRKGMSACCQRMEKRCRQSCQSFPKSGRAEFCGRCLTAGGKICQTNKPQGQKPPSEKAGMFDPLPRSMSSRFRTILATIEAEIKRKEDIGLGGPKAQRSRHACYIEKLKRPDVDDRVIEWDTICQPGVLFTGGCSAQVGMKPKEADLKKHIKSQDDVEDANRKIFPPFIIHWRNYIVFWDDATGGDLANRVEVFESVSRQIHQTNHKLWGLANIMKGGSEAMPMFYRGIAGWFGERQKDPKSVLSCK
jgi:hypothetical protein